MNFSLKDVEYFLSAARLGGLGQAARACGVTQPSITRAIQRLEAEFGLPLFERTAHGADLTLAGRRFMEVAQNLSTSYDNASRFAAEVRARQAGNLRIGVTNTTRMSFVPAALSTLVRQRPGIRVALRAGPSDQLVQAVQEGELDIAVIPSDGEWPENCQGVEVGTDPYLPVVSARHPLAKHSTVAPSDLVGYSWIAGAQGSAAYRTLAATCARCAIPPPTVTVEADRITEMTLAMVQSTELLILVPRSLFRATDRHGLHILPVPEFHIARTALCLVRKGVAWSPLMDAFVQTMTAMNVQHEKQARIPRATTTGEDT